MKKLKFTKKHFLITIAVLLIGWIIYPIVFQVIHLYVWRPTPNPKPEDFLVIDDSFVPEYEPEPLSDDEVEIYFNAEEKQIVDAKIHGYKLEIDPALKVKTNKLQPELIAIDLSNSCGASVYVEDFINLSEFIPNAESIEDSDFGTELISFTSKKISDSPLAYEIVKETDVSGYIKNIYLQGDEKVYSINQNITLCEKYDIAGHIYQNFKLK